MKLFDLCTCVVYEKEGEEKRKFYKAGIMTETADGRKYLRLFNQPDVKFFIFERQKPETENKGSEEENNSLADHD